jgi:amidase
MKPTRARTPLGPDFGDQYAGLVIDHAVTRSVRDSAALLDATAGYDPGDPYVAPPVQRPYLEEARIDPGALRVGLIADVFGRAGLHEDCLAAVQDAARLCESLGHHIEELVLPRVPGGLVGDMFDVIWSAGAASDVDAIMLLAGRAPEPHELEPLTWALAEKGRGYSAPTLLSAVMILQRLSREMRRATEAFDVILTPTLAEPPLAIGALDPKPDDPLYGYDRAGDFCPFTAIFNVTGQPAMSVPLYWNAAGLPIGAQFVGRYGDEATLFRLAGQLERARPWFDRRPPVS